MLDRDGIGTRAVTDAGYSPNDMERDAQALLDSLIPQRDAETDKRKRKELSRRVKTARMLRDWARTRAGYIRAKKRISSSS